MAEIPSIYTPLPGAGPKLDERDKAMMDSWNAFVERSKQPTQDMDWEKAKVDGFIRNLHQVPEDEIDGGWPDWTSAVGRRQSEVSRFAEGLSEQGKAMLGERIRGAFERDKAHKEAEEAAQRERWLQEPGLMKEAWSYVGPFVRSTLDIPHNVSFGWIPSWNKGWEMGIQDAMIQNLVEDGRGRGIPEDKVLDWALQQMENLPLKYKIASMASALPEIGQMGLAFGLIEAGTAGVGGAMAGSSAAARLGMTAARAAKYGEYLQTLRKAKGASRVAGEALRLLVDAGKAAKGGEEIFKLGGALRSARTFAIADALSPEHRPEVGWWEGLPSRFVQGGAAGLVVGGVGVPAGKSLDALFDKASLSWLRGSSYWNLRRSQSYAAQGVEERIAFGGFKPIKDPKTGKEIFKVGEKTFEVDAWNKGIRERAGRLLDIPGRVESMVAFPGMAYVHGTEGMQAMLEQGALGFFGHGAFIGFPITGAARRLIPGSKEYRQKREEAEIIESIREQQVDTTIRGGRWVEISRALRSQADLASKVTKLQSEKEMELADRQQLIKPVPGHSSPKWLGKLLLDPTRVPELHEMVRGRLRQLAADKKRNTDEYRELVSIDRIIWESMARDAHREHAPHNHVLVNGRVVPLKTFRKETPWLGGGGEHPSLPSGVLPRYDTTGGNRISRFGGTVLSVKKAEKIRKVGPKPGDKAKAPDKPLSGWQIRVLSKQTNTRVEDNEIVHEPIIRTVYTKDPRLAAIASATMRESKNRSRGGVKRDKQGFPRFTVPPELKKAPPPASRTDQLNQLFGDLPESLIGDLKTRLEHYVQGQMMLQSTPFQAQVGDIPALRNKMTKELKSIKEDVDTLLSVTVRKKDGGTNKLSLQDILRVDPTHPLWHQNALFRAVKEVFPFWHTEWTNGIDAPMKTEIDRTIATGRQRGPKVHNQTVKALMSEGGGVEYRQTEQPFRPQHHWVPNRQELESVLETAVELHLTSPKMQGMLRDLAQAKAELSYPEAATIMRDLATRVYSMAFYDNLTQIASAQSAGQPFKINRRPWTDRMSMFEMEQEAGKYTEEQIRRRITVYRKKRKDFRKQKLAEIKEEGWLDVYGVSTKKALMEVMNRAVRNGERLIRFRNEIFPDEVMRMIQAQDPSLRSLETATREEIINYLHTPLVNRMNAATIQTLVGGEKPKAFFRLKENIADHMEEAPVPAPAPPVEDTRRPRMRVRMIISGGQTGADRGGLEGARVLGLETGGVAPEGFVTEAGRDPSLREFGLGEVPSTDPATLKSIPMREVYRRRTEQNVKNSDATVIFAKNKNSPGTRLTIGMAKKHGKPIIINPTAKQLRDFAVKHDVEVLNVAGNRESKAKGTQKRVAEIIESAFAKSPELELWEGELIGMIHDVDPSISELRIQFAMDRAEFLDVEGVAKELFKDKPEELNKFLNVATSMGLVGRAPSTHRDVPYADTPDGIVRQLVEEGVPVQLIEKLANQRADNFSDRVVSADIALAAKLMGVGAPESELSKEGLHIQTGSEGEQLLRMEERIIDAINRYEESKSKPSEHRQPTDAEGAKALQDWIGEGEPVVKGTMPMYFEHGKQGSMRPDLVKRGIKSTMDAILSGDRTATTRKTKPDVKPGDLIEFTDGKGKKVVVEVTTAPYKAGSISAEEWSKLEGWAPSMHARYKDAWQFQYRVRSTAPEPTEARVPQKNVKRSLAQMVEGEMALGAEEIKSRLPKEKRGEPSDAGADPMWDLNTDPAVEPGTVSRSQLEASFSKRHGTGTVYRDYPPNLTEGDLIEVKGRKKTMLARVRSEPEPLDLLGEDGRQVWQIDFRLLRKAELDSVRAQEIVDTVHNDALRKASEALDSYAQTIDRIMETATSKKHKRLNSYTDDPRNPKAEALQAEGRDRLNKEMSKKFLLELSRGIVDRPDLEPLQWLPEFPSIAVNTLMHEFRGRVLLHMEETNDHWQRLPTALKGEVYDLFVDRVSRDMFPTHKKHPGQSYRDWAMRQIAQERLKVEQEKGLRLPPPSETEIQGRAKVLRGLVEDVVQDMLQNFQASVALARAEMQQGNGTSALDELLNRVQTWAAKHPYMTGAVLAGLSAAGWMTGDGGLGGSVLAGLPLAAVPLGTRIAPGIKGSQKARRKALEGTNGFLRWAMDSRREPDTWQGLGDLLNNRHKTGSKKGELKKLTEARSWIYRTLGLPEFIAGSHLTDNAAYAHVLAENDVVRDAELFFGTQATGRLRHGKEVKGWLSDVEIGSPLDRLLFDMMDGFRRFRNGKAARYQSEEWLTQMRLRKQEHEMERQARIEKGEKDIGELDLDKAIAIAKKLHRYRQEIRDRFTEFVPGAKHWARDEFGLDDYWHRIFPNLADRKDWYDHLPWWMTRFIDDPRKVKEGETPKEPKTAMWAGKALKGVKHWFGFDPSTYNRTSFMMARGDQKYQYEGSAVSSLLAYAPAARWAYRMMRFGKVEAKDHLFGRWSPIGWKLRMHLRENAGEFLDQKQQQTLKNEELTKLLSPYSLENLPHYSTKPEESGLGGIRLSQGTLDKMKASSNRFRSKEEGEAYVGDPNTEWFLVREDYRSHQDYVTLIRADKANLRNGDSQTTTLSREMSKQGHKEGWVHRVHVSEFDSAQIRMGGLAALGDKVRMEEAIKYVDYITERRTKPLEKMLDRWAGWLYHTTIGSMDPRPAMHNLIGGQWLNFTELGMKYWYDGMKLAMQAAVAAQPGDKGWGTAVGKAGGVKPSQHWLNVLHESGLFHEGTYFGESVHTPAMNHVMAAIRRTSFYFFRKAEDANRAVAYLGAYKRAMDRIEAKTGRPFDPNARWEYGGRGFNDRPLDSMSQKEYAHRSGVRAVSRTAAWYSAVNAPKAFRHPVGRLMLHLNRFSIMYMNEAFRAIKDVKKRPQRLARGVVAGMVLYQLGQQLGTDLGFVFGQPLQDVGLEFLSDEATLGGLMPSLRDGDWSMSGILGDLQIPMAMPYDVSPPLRVGADLGSVLYGALTDDMNFMDSFAYQLQYRYRHMLETVVPMYKLARRVAGAATAVDHEWETPLNKGLVRVAQGQEKTPFGQMLGRMMRTAGLMPSMSVDGTRKDPFEIRGMRDRMAYRTTSEVMWKRLLAPGIPLEVVNNIRQNQQERSILEQSRNNRSMGYDRLLAALEAGETDVVNEIMDAYHYRPQDIERQWEMRNHPSWIRSLSGTVNDKVDAIYSRFERGVNSHQEIIEALTVHVSSESDLDGDAIRKIRDMISGGD